MLDPLWNIFNFSFLNSQIKKKFEKNEMWRFLYTSKHLKILFQRN